MIPLQPGFMTVYGYKKFLSTMSGGISTLFECTGVKEKTDLEGINAVYVYTFVDGNGNYVNKNTKINGVIRSADDSFAAADIPYEDGLFIFPKKDGKNMTVNIAARYPDGILLFNYGGYFGPVPPFGTIVKVKRLHIAGGERTGYPDQKAHALIETGLNATLNNLRTTNQAAYAAFVISLNGQNVAIGTKPNISDIIIGACGYISIMNVIKNSLIDAGYIGAGGNARSSFRKRSHNNNNNKSIKRNKTKSKTKGRGRARAASMLKSAKQRFYRRGGGGGLGSRGPQPLQRNSQLVSQASPV
jgi:hypothetical protein